MPETISTLDFGAPGFVDGSLSERVRGLVGSEILRIAADIRIMKAAGTQVCDLTVGDFNSKYFPIPAALKRGIQEALDAGETNYPPSNGLPELRVAVADFVAREWGPRYPLESVLIASGARPILYAAYRCVINPGDKIVYPVPSWNNNHYTWMCDGVGVPVPNQAADGFMPTLAQLAPHLSDARMLCINSPLNPTGTVIGEAALREITQAVVDENLRRTREGRPHLFLLYDQVYASLVFGAKRHLMPVSLVPESAPWVICLDGVSKAFASTGLRVGWVMAAPEVVARMKSLLGHVGAWAPRPEQVAVARFLNDVDAVREYQVEMNRRVEQRLDRLYEGFEAMKRDGYPVECISPQGAIYLSVCFDLLGSRVGETELVTNDAIRKIVLDRAGLAMVPFQAFGLEGDSGWFRLSVGAVSLDEIDAVLPRLRRLLDDVER